MERKFREVKEGMAGERRYKAAIAGQRIEGTAPVGADGDAHAGAPSTEYEDMSFRWGSHSSSGGDPAAPSLLNGLHELYQHHHHQPQGQQYQHQSHSPLDRWTPGRAPSHGRFEEDPDVWRRPSGSEGSPVFWHDHPSAGLGAMTPDDLRRMSDYDMNGGRGSFSSFSVDTQHRGSNAASYPPVYVPNQAGHGTMSGTPISGMNTPQLSGGLGPLSVSPASYSFGSHARPGSAMPLQRDGHPSVNSGYGNEMLGGSSGSSGAGAHARHGYPPPLSLESLFSGQHHSAGASAPPMNIGQAITTGFMSSIHESFSGVSGGPTTPASMAPVQQHPAQGSSYERMYGERLPDINEGVVANHSLSQHRPSFRHSQTDHPPYSPAEPRGFLTQDNPISYAPGGDPYPSASLAGSGPLESKPAFSCPASIHTSPVLAPATAPIPPPAPWSESFRSAFQSSFNSLTRPQPGVRSRAATTGQHNGSQALDQAADPPQSHPFSINLSPDTPGFSSPTGRFFTQGNQDEPTPQLRIAAPAAPPPGTSWSSGYGTSGAQDGSSLKQEVSAHDADVTMDEGHKHGGDRHMGPEQMLSRSQMQQLNNAEPGPARMAPSLTLDMSFKALGHLGGTLGTSNSSPATTMPSTPFPLASGWAGQQAQSDIMATSPTAIQHMRAHEHSLHVQVERVAHAKNNLVYAAVADHQTGMAVQVDALGGASWGTAGATIDPKLVSPLKSSWSSPAATRAPTPLLQGASRSVFLHGGAETIAKPAAPHPDLQTAQQRLTEPSGLSLASPATGQLAAAPPPLRRASDSDTPPTLRSNQSFFPSDGTQSFPPR